MRKVTRRSFLSASAALAAAPAFAAIPASPVDAVIIGAGAAGIAAARRLQASEKTFAILEAADRVGGRCITDTQLFGVPFDRGAHWIHMPDINPVSKLLDSKLDVYDAPRWQKLRIGDRYAREGEMENFLAALVRCNRAIAEAAAHGKTDVSCAQALPKDLGDLRPAVEFVLGPYGCAKDLADISASDFAKSAERDLDAFCRQGFGTLLALLAAGLPVELSTPAARIDFSGRGVEVETAQGKLAATTAIVTVSTAVLASGGLKFKPALPKRVLDGCAKLSLGSYDHIALEIEGNPLRLLADDVVFEKSANNRTAMMVANVSGTSLHLINVAGRFGKSLAAQGEPAMIVFALEWLTKLYGADIKKAVKRRAATQWHKEPFALGAFSAAAPGSQPARRTLMEPVAGRIFFAGEAVHETLWGTVGGAWESGERAADAALKRLAKAS